MKFFVCFIIIFLACGAGFFIGWTQFKVDTDSVAVLVSKTGGVSDSLVKPGEFSWHWEFLLPTNAKLKIFRTTPYSFRKKISGVLPSGDVYASFYKVAPDFSYNFNLEILLSISEDALTGLVKDGRIESQDSLEEYLKNASDVVFKYAVNKMISSHNETQPLILELVDYSSFFSDVDISKSFPGVSVEKIDVLDVRIPDFKLYERTQEIYIEKMRDSLGSASLFKNASNSLSESEGKSATDDVSSIDGKKALELLEQLRSVLQTEER